MVDPAVLRRFSAVAARYDAHARAQRRSARDLLAFTLGSLPSRRSADPPDAAGQGTAVFRILEPGCGTGLYTRMLLDAFPGASVFGVDVSEPMVRIARRTIGDPRARFVVADAEEIAAGRYDLVTSNATFQWFRFLPRTLARTASLLSPGGVLTFSFFGPETYGELDGALRAAAGTRRPGEEERVAAASFHPRSGIAAALAAAFSSWEIAERRYHEEFPALADLLRSIRYTGTRGAGVPGRWSPGRLARVEEAYREMHGAIRATYQVFLCRGSDPAGRNG